MPKNSLCHLRCACGRDGRSMALRRAFIGMCWPVGESKPRRGNQDQQPGIKILQWGTQFSRRESSFRDRDLNSHAGN